MFKLSKKEKKEKELRFAEYKIKKYQAEQIKDLFGNHNKDVRKQLFNIHKDSLDFKKDLEFMKKIIKGGK